MKIIQLCVFRKKYTRFWLFPYLFFATGLKAQEPFEPLQNFRTGLSGYVDDITPDSHGFLWLANGDKGFSRFDGRSFAQYKFPFESGYVSFLQFDSQKNALWIGSKGCLGKLRFDDWHFQKYELPDSFASETKLFWITDGHRDGNKLWLATLLGLVEFDLEKELITGIYRQPLAEVHSPGREMANFFKSIQPDLARPDWLWLGSECGVAVFDKKSRTFRRFLNPLKQVHDFARYVLPLINGRILVGPESGLWEIDPTSGNWQKCELPGGSDQSKFFLVEGLLQVGADTVLITGNSGHFGFYSIAQKEVVWEGHAESDIVFMHRDRLGDFWAGNSLGLWHLERKKTLGHAFLEPNPVEPKGFLPFRVDLDKSSGKLIVASAYRYGATLIDVATGQFQPLMLVGKSPKMKTNGLARLSENEWLVGCDSILAVWRSDQNALYKFKWQPTGAFNIRAILKSKTGEIWVSTHNTGIFRLSADGITERRFYNELQIPEIKNFEGSRNDLFEDRAGRIWSTTVFGISVFDPLYQKWHHFPQKNGDPLTIGYPHSFAEDGLGNLFAVGNDSVLMIAPKDWEGGGTRILKQGDGLRSARYFTAAVDGAGRLLLGTDLGIERLDMRTGNSVVCPTNSIPIQILESHIRLFPMPNGELAVVTRRGLAILPESVFSQKMETARPWISSILINNKARQQSGDDFSLEKLELAPNENVLELRFSALGFDHPSRNRFLYKMEGIDRDWVEADGNNLTAKYAHLPSGNYVFRVKAVSPFFGESPHQAALSIHVETPFYQTIWAFLGYFLIVFGIIWLIFRERLARQSATSEAHRLAELDNFKTRLFTNFTHEFRTPLTLILGLAQKGKRQKEPLPTIDFHTIERQGEQMLALVNQMLDLSKLDSGGLVLHEEVADIVRFLRTETALYESLSGLRGILLVFQNGLVAPVYPILFDGEKLRHIVSNLLSNALKFTPSGGSIELSIFEKMGLNAVEIRVRDSGKGIPPELADRVFERFWQSESAARSGGTGIGLAIVREFAELMGGSATVVTGVGQVGADFRVVLPLKAFSGAFYENRGLIEPAFLDHKTTIKNKEKQSGQTEGRPFALIVEDNSDVAAFIADSLPTGWQIELATDGADGFQRALERLPDLILSDVMMPNMTGFELCRALKNDPRTDHIPVILLTARADANSRLTGLREQADVYLSKPFQQEELCLQAENLLRRQRLLQKKWASILGKTNETARIEPTPESVFLEKIKSILENRALDSAFSVPALASEMGMGQSQFQRKLTAITGLTAVETILGFRLEKASGLLISTGLNISEIAYQTGFEDPHYFARAFSKKMGHSPTEHRRQARD